FGDELATERTCERSRIEDPLARWSPGSLRGARALLASRGHTRVSPVRRAPRRSRSRRPRRARVLRHLGVSHLPHPLRRARRHGPGAAWTLLLSPYAAD